MSKKEFWLEFYTKELDRIEKTINNYEKVGYRDIFITTIKRILKSKLWQICSAIMLLSTLIQYLQIGTPLLVSLITSTPIIITPIICGITNCFSYRSFYKFDIERLHYDKELFSEAINKVNESGLVITE